MTSRLTRNERRLLALQRLEEFRPHCFDKPAREPSGYIVRLIKLDAKISKLRRRIHDEIEHPHNA